MRHALRNAQNRNTGALFERALSWEAARAEILAVRNGQTVRWLPGGRTVAVKSNLDWILVKAGKVVCLDNKSFAGRRFGRSMLEPHQLALAQRYTDFGILAGFLVHLREINAVVFYSAQALSSSNLRQGWGLDDGLHMGTLQAFDLDKLWAA